MTSQELKIQAHYFQLIPLISVVVKTPVATNNSFQPIHYGREFLLCAIAGPPVRVSVRRSSGGIFFHGCSRQPHQLRLSQDAETNFTYVYLRTALLYRVEDLRRSKHFLKHCSRKYPSTSWFDPVILRSCWKKGQEALAAAVAVGGMLGDGIVAVNLGQKNIPLIGVKHHHVCPWWRWGTK